MSMQKMRLDVEDRAGAAVILDVSIRWDTVELRVNDELVGVADRTRLRAWLRAPEGMYVCGGLTWMWNGFTIAVHVQDVVPTSLLRSHVVETLRLYL